MVRYGRPRFFIYDNISDPAQTVAQGYTIGIEDKLGVRGVTYAYAPAAVIHSRRKVIRRRPERPPSTAGAVWRG